LRNLLPSFLALTLILSGCVFFGIGADATVMVVRHYWHNVLGQEAVEYTVKNTGTLPLVTVTVRFKAVCQDGTSYQETGVTTDYLDLKQSKSETVYISTNQSPVVEIKVMEIQKSAY
jgi:hypothetical protein